MHPTPEYFVAVNKSAVDALLNGVYAALAGAERMSALNFNTARAALEDSTSVALIATPLPKDADTLRSSLVQPSVERAVSYSRSACKIAAETQQHLAKQAEIHFGDFQRQITALVEAATKNAPGGSEAAASAVKTAFAAANSAFDSMNKAAQSFVEVTEHSISATGEASITAVGKTVASTKRK